MHGLEEADANSLTELAKSASVHSIGAATADKARHTQCIVSGDLSARGSDSELSMALTFVRAQLALTLPMADLVGLGYTRSSHVILGNHDVWGGAHPITALIRSERRKRKANNVLWQSYPTPWNVAQQDPPVTAVDSNGLRVRVYLLDSTWTGLTNLFARGRVPQAQLNRLTEIVKLDQKTDRSAGQIHTTLKIAVVHHPIAPPERHRFTMLLEHAKQLEGCLQHLGFGMVLCGHEHEYSITELEGGLFQCLAGTASQASADGVNQFYVYELSIEQQGVSHRVQLDVREYTRQAHGPQPFSPSAAIRRYYPKCAAVP
jgi:hypothetical protein